MKVQEFIEKLTQVAHDFNTVYMWGSFGQPLTKGFINQKTLQYPDFYTKQRQSHLNSLVPKKYFAFDCVGLIKGLLWGWNGDHTKPRGGAGYGINGVPDIDANTMFKICKDQSADFRNIIPGEAVWLKGHIGIYIGGGKVVEATPKWENGVQITACLNIGPIGGLNGRKWNAHGKLPYIDYSKPVPTPVQAEWMKVVKNAEFDDEEYWMGRFNEIIEEGKKHGSKDRFLGDALIKIAKRGNK